MLNIEERLQVKIDQNNSELSLRFNSETERTIYDICDVNGRILKTGKVSDESTTVDLSKLPSDRYILLILDGDRIFSRHFRWNA